MTFCSNFIKTTLSLHLHEAPHKILKFSSGSRENTFQRSRHPLNFEQYSYSIIQQFFSRGPKPFLEEEYKTHSFIHQIFPKHLYVPNTAKNAGELPATQWSREMWNVFLLSPGGNSTRAGDRAVFRCCHKPGRAPTDGSLDLKVLIIQERERVTLDVLSQVWIWTRSPQEIISSLLWWSQLSFWALPLPVETETNHRVGSPDPAVRKGNWEQPVPESSTGVTKAIMAKRLTPNSPAQILTAQTTSPPPHILNHAPSTTLGLGACHFRTEQQWLGQGNHEERERFCCPQEKCWVFFNSWTEVK